MFRNGNLSNLEIVLQRNLRTDSARECIFRASGGTSFSNLPAWHQPWCCLCEFNICTGLPKKTLKMSLVLSRYNQFVVSCQMGCK